MDDNLMVKLVDWLWVVEEKSQTVQSGFQGVSAFIDYISFDSSKAELIGRVSQIVEPEQGQFLEWLLDRISEYKSENRKTRVFDKFRIQLSNH